MAARLAFDIKPLALPSLAWVTGIVHEILVQPGEQFYIFAIQPLMVPQSYCASPTRTPAHLWRA